MSISKVSGETIIATFGGGYALQGTLATTEFNPVSVTSYYGGDAVGTTASTTAQSRRIYIPKTGTIKSCYGFFFNNSVQFASSAGTLYINVNNGAYTTIGTQIHIANRSLYSNTTLSIAVTRGDYIEFKWVCPFYPPGRMLSEFVVYVE